jgi:hypothetical protein
VLKKKHRILSQYKITLNLIPAANTMAALTVHNTVFKVLLTILGALQSSYVKKTEMLSKNRYLKLVPQL